MGCRRPLSMEDRAAIGAGLESGLCQARITRILGRSPSVIRSEIKRNAGADGCYRGGEAGRMAARRRTRPKERALKADPVLRARAWSGLARGRTPRQISGRLKARSAWRGWGTMADSPAADGRTISHEAIYTWIHTPSRRRGLVEHGIVLASLRWDAQKSAPLRWVVSLPGRGDAVDRAGALTSTTARCRGTGRTRPDHRQEAGRASMVGDPGRPPCATSSWWAFPRGREGRPGVRRPHRRIRALPDGAMSTLTWDQGSEMARHQRQGRRHRDRACSFAHPHSPWERGTNENTNRLVRRYLPKGTPITSHQPYPGAIADEPGNCPRATLDYHTPQEALTQLIATTT